MLRVLGSPKRLCNGTTRRDLIYAGGLSLFGLGLSDFLHLQKLQAATPSTAALPGFGRAKSCILLYLYGSPSQLETVDMKPGAPDEVRGELKPIASSVPGLPVCELMPHSARVMDRVSVVRSMTHPYPIHGVAYATTGVPTIEVAMELSPHDPRHWPFMGSVVDFLAQRARGGRPPEAVPDNIGLPFHFSTQRVGEVARAGPYAAFLGGAYNPVWTEFHGEATRNFVKTLQDKRIEVREPYMGITPQSRFELAGATSLPNDITIDRLNRRRSLVEQFDLGRRDLDASAAARSFDRHQELALSMIASQKVRSALDIQQEAAKTRESYGMTLFGQSCLAARRLVEAGSRFVTAFWDEFGLAGSAWDTHWNHYPRMKDELMPGFDMGFAGLIADMESRGMLDETLVLCLSEHGRTPKLNKAAGGGRDHWSSAYSILLAGGGVTRGNVIGKTDKHAATVVERPVSPKDILATAYHLLGIDQHTILYDRIGRPLPLVADGQIVPELLA
jgi:hypothetical protein